MSLASAISGFQMGAPGKSYPLKSRYRQTMAQYCSSVMMPLGLNYPLPMPLTMSFLAAQLM